MRTMNITVPRITPERAEQIGQMMPGFEPSSGVPVIETLVLATAHAEAAGNNILIKKGAARNGDYVGKVTLVQVHEESWDFVLNIARAIAQ